MYKCNLQTTLTERIISTQRESVVDFFVYAMKKHSYLHMLFLKYETQIGEKKYWIMFFNLIAVHMRKF